MQIERSNSVLDAAVKIWFDIAVICRSQAITAGENFLQLPLAGAGAARFFGRVMVNHTPASTLHPIRVDGNSRVWSNGLVAAKVQAEKYGNRLRGILRQVDQEPYPGPLLPAGKVNQDLFPDGLAVQSVRIHRNYLERHS